MSTQKSDSSSQNSSDPGDMSNPEELHEKCGWNKYSEGKLIHLEKKILNVLKTAYSGWHVPIQHKNGKEAKIWTISINTESKKTPLVLLHGFGAAVGFWCLNLDKLAAKRPVYAIDLLGFGRSSRPDFSSDGLEAEKEFVESIENWRKEVKLERFVLLGHSFGGYLAMSYTMAHPERVKHLILADPWGFGEKATNFNPPLLIRTLGVVLYPLTALNPLSTIRAAGPLGPWIVKKMRSDIANKYGGTLEDPQIISDYIYQCNSQKPTGETAFHRMIRGFGWAKNPMLHRIDNLKAEVPITIFHGSDTWMDRTIGGQLKDLRPQSYVRVEVIADAGHHVHADNPDSFNDLVVDVCEISETEICNKIMDSIDMTDKMIEDLEEAAQNSELVKST